MWGELPLVWCTSQVEFSSYFYGDEVGGVVRGVILSYYVCRSLDSFVHDWTLFVGSCVQTALVSWKTLSTRYLENCFS